jgi:hypothetical protein
MTWRSLSLTKSRIPGDPWFKRRCEMQAEVSCSSRSASFGCVVVLEPGAKWPGRAFASIPYRDGVVILSESAGEALDRFIMRLNTQCALMAASGVSFRAAIVACNDAGPMRESYRGKLASNFVEHVFAERDYPIVFVRSAADTNRAPLGRSRDAPTKKGSPRPIPPRQAVGHGQCESQGVALCFPNDRPSDRDGTPLLERIPRRL